jgi:hypothetical protein
LCCELPFAVVGLVGLVLVVAGVTPELLAVVLLVVVGTLTVVGLGLEADAGAPEVPVPEEALVPAAAAPWVEAGWGR